MLTRRALLASPLLALPAAAAGASTPAGDGDDDGLAALPHAWEPVDLSFVRHAPHSVVNEVVLPASPACVFEVLADPEPWPRWLPLVEGVTYRKPFGKTTVRDVATLGGTLIREQFFCWDVGERFAFSVVRSSSSVGRHFLEDYLLRPVQGGATRLIWTCAFAPQDWAAPTGPLLVAAFAAVAPSSLRRLQLEVKARAARGT